MGSSFEDLAMRGPTVKTDCNSYKWFKSYDFLNFLPYDIKCTRDVFEGIYMSCNKLVLFRRVIFPFRAEC
jgi:hypothetical protein